MNNVWKFWKVKNAFSVYFYVLLTRFLYAFSCKVFTTSHQEEVGKIYSSLTETDTSEIENAVTSSTGNVIFTIKPNAHRLWSLKKTVSPTKYNTSISTTSV